MYYKETTDALKVKSLFIIVTIFCMFDIDILLSIDFYRKRIDQGK